MHVALHLRNGGIVAIQAAAQRGRPHPALRIDREGHDQVAGEAVGIFRIRHDVIEFSGGAVKPIDPGAPRR